MSSTTDRGMGATSHIDHDILLLDVAFKRRRIADEMQTNQCHCTRPQIQVVTEKFARLQLYTESRSAQPQGPTGSITQHSGDDNTMAPTTPPSSITSTSFSRREIQHRHHSPGDLVPQQQSSQQTHSHQRCTDTNKQCKNQDSQGQEGEEVLRTHSPAGLLCHQGQADPLQRENHAPSSSPGQATPPQISPLTQRPSTQHTSAEIASSCAAT